MSLVQALRERMLALEQRHRELEQAVADPARAGKPDYSRLLQELGRLNKTLEPWIRYQRLEQELRDARALAEGGDAELAALAREELPAHEQAVARLEEQLVDRALEQDEDGDRPAIVEIRAGTGGEEAALFAADLLRIYGKFAAARGWKLEIVDSSPSDMGGYREIILRLEGEGAYRQMRLETGGHRVQRVPETEAQGRIHTSAATVAVLPEVEEVDFELKPEELEITAMRSSGPGGQHVNKTSSAIRVVHLPTGTMVKCQEDKSQLRNRAKALALLRSRLYEIERQKREAERSAMRRNQIGSGDRSERIRTYNWPQNRVTDHRLGRNFSLETILEGRLDELVETLLAADREAKLAAL
ncbi:MAG: peptide chain release factor 1 [Planctomycetota bacterium]|nr:MAG: peptide chain release factor 1 [Planctomycetota bacterium]